MFKWIAIFVIFISGGILGYLYIDLKNLEENPDLLPPVEKTNSTRIIHSFNDGVHRYSGQIKLPHSCFSITTNVSYDPINNGGVLLFLTTKDNLLEQKFCSQIPTRYPFETIVEAPMGVPVTLTIDGVARTISITETGWTSPRGTIITK